MLSRFLKTRIRVDEFGAILVLLILIISQVAGSLATSALTPAQKQVIQEGAKYFNVDSCSTDGTTTTGSTNNKVYIIGDSLTVGMRDLGNLKAKLSNGGWDVTDIEATTGISIHDSIPKVTADQGHAVSQASTVVVGLGTNPAGGGSVSEVEDMIKAINSTSPDATIVWINAYSTSADYSGFNTILSNHAGDGKGKINKILDWAQEAKSNTASYNLASGGGIHTTPAGYIKRSEWVVSGLGSLPSAAQSASSPIASCCDNSASTQLTGSGPGEQVFNYFISKGLSNESAAAATGNLQVESANWGYINKWGGGGGDYYGLAQWSRNDRYPKLVSFSGGAANPTLAQQLDFVWHELTTDSSYKSTLDILKSNSASLRDKALMWVRNYEGAVNKDGSLQMPNERVANAIRWAQQAGGSSAGGAVPDSSSPDSGGGACASTSGAGGYSNPFHSTDGLVQSRIDEGVDYASTKPVPIYAIGNGIVKIATDHSTFYTTSGGHADWITYQLTDGPAKGKYIYISEACPPLVRAGDKVTSETHMCDVLPDSIETGWALDDSSQAAAAVNVYRKGYETAYGVNFNDLMKKLGAPGGHLDAASDPSGTVLGNLPADWPKW